ncbi:hypothetical protein [Mycolicibacterium thermoresistibile]
MTLPPSNNPPPPGGGLYPPHQPGGQGGPQYVPWQLQHQQQPQWAGGPPPKKRGNGWKWALGGVALVAVIAVTAVVSISVAGGGDSSPTAPSGDGDSEFASANDTGPVNIITEDPTCAVWTPIASTLVAIEQRGWDKRNPTIPATAWTAEQRTQYEDVGRAMRDAADQTIQLAELTPNRVLRHFYEQFIAYARAYSSAIPDYTPDDNHLAGVVNSSSGAVTFTCAAITYGSAQARQPLVAAPSISAGLPSTSDPARVQPFLSAVDPICADWYQLLTNFDSDPIVESWKQLDANISASEWSTDQRAVVDAVKPVMDAFANDIEKLGEASDNPAMRDFAAFATQYRRAYVKALPTYTAADSYLSRAAARATSTIYEACKAAEVN